MSKPSGVSEAAWEFACSRATEDLDLKNPRIREAYLSKLQDVREDLARAFDAATEELRTTANSMRAYCEFHTGHSAADAAVLARYTPEES